MDNIDEKEKILLDDILEVCSKCDNSINKGCGIQDVKVISKNLKCHNFFWEIWNKDDLKIEEANK